MSTNALPGVAQWSDLTAPELSRWVAADAVAVLPLGAIEQHGPHLPLSTDVDIGQGLLNVALRQLGSAASAPVSVPVPVLVLPGEALGASPEHTGHAGTLDRGAAALSEAIYATGAALARAGLRRLVLHNSHGGNKALIDQVALRLRSDFGMLVVKAHWFRFPRPSDPRVTALPEKEWTQGLHGGAIETAMMLHLHPDRVRHEHIARFASLDEQLEGQLTHLRAEGAASFAWLAGDLNAQGVTGDATQASAELGRALVEHYGAVLAEIIVDAHRFPMEQLSAFEPGLAQLLAPLDGVESWVVGQLGQSVDGRIATQSGHSHYINGPADLVRLHSLRAAADAVVVGAGTVAADNPQLTVRRVNGDNPVRVVLDPSARLGPDHHVFTDGAAATLHIVAEDAGRSSESQPGFGAHVETLALPRTAEGSFDPHAVIDVLRARGLGRLLIEGGGLTVSGFVEAGALDRLHISVAPLLIGSGRPGLTLPVIDRLDEAQRPPVRHVVLGDDVVFDFDLSAWRRPSSTNAPGRLPTSTKRP